MLSFFDCNVCLGKRGPKHPLEMWKTEDILAEAGYALFVDNSELDLADVAPILSAHNNLNMVITGVTCGQERMLFGLLSRFCRLYFDLSSLQTNRLPELMYDRFGWGKVMFGSGMPVKSAGAARVFFDYAEVFQPALKDFACGNLCNLLKLRRPDPEEPKCDEIAMEAFQGTAISVPVLDSHAHWQSEGQTHAWLGGLCQHLPGG